MENESDEKLFLELAPIIENAIRQQFEKDAIEPLCIKHLSPPPVWNEQEPPEYVQHCLDNNYLLSSSGMTQDFDFQDLSVLTSLLEDFVARTYVLVKDLESTSDLHICGSTFFFCPVQPEQDISHFCVNVTFLLSGRVTKPEEWWARPLPARGLAV